MLSYDMSRNPFPTPPSTRKPGEEDRAPKTRPVKDGEFDDEEDAFVIDWKPTGPRPGKKKSPDR
jgi:hypothetical protein